MKVIPDGHFIASTYLSEKWKEEYDRSIIFIETGWYKRRVYTREFQFEFPDIPEDAVEFLIERDAKAIGIDTFGIELYENSEFRVHKRLLSQGIPFIEDIYCLDELEKGKPYMIAALRLKIKAAGGSMARVIANEFE